MEGKKIKFKMKLDNKDVLITAWGWYVPAVWGSPENSREAEGEMIIISGKRGRHELSQGYLYDHYSEIEEVFFDKIGE